MERIAFYIDNVITNIDNEVIIHEVRNEIAEWMSKYPLFAK